jgi:hypothetical protein
MKFLVCFSLFALAGYVACFNATWGYISPYDVIVHQSIRYQKSKFLQIRSENVTFPFGNQRNNRTITGIRLIDQIPRSQAFGQVISGGINFNHTTIRLKSQRGQGYNFIVEIYGRR